MNIRKQIQDKYCPICRRKELDCYTFSKRFEEDYSIWCKYCGSRLIVNEYTFQDFDKIEEWEVPTWFDNNYKEGE